MFQPLYQEAIRSLVPDKVVCDGLWQDIVKHYSEVRRHYHNLQHLDQLAHELSAVKDAIQEWNIMMLSTAYHDIIYNTRRQDNEEASAAYARSVLVPYLS